jgi:hypothetical protein
MVESTRAAFQRGAKRCAARAGAPTVPLTAMARHAQSRVIELRRHAIVASFSLFTELQREDYRFLSPG